MKLIKKILWGILFILAFLFILHITSNASYSIENMDIQAIILDNGDVNIKQSITYKFDGSYNGIYISVPYRVDDVERDEIISNNRINDDLYTGSGIEINSIKDSNNAIYTETDYARNGMKGVYTIEGYGGIRTIKVYSPSSNTTKTFILDYTIEDLCVKHNDIGELYYNLLVENGM